MPMDMNSGSTAILDDEAPIEAAPKKSHKKNNFMSADDTDNERVQKKDVSLSHKGKGFEIE